MILILLALVAAQVSGEAVNLKCADNATCIDALVRDFVGHVKAGRAVKLFDALTVEPLGRRDGRSMGNPFSKFFERHAFTIDLSDYALRLSQPEHRSDAVQLEVFQQRATGKFVHFEKGFVNIQ
ncbi:hypothetical protein EVAR_12273_1 [Eumeta japonica]|uniref:Protein takeout n=1 Tax=Eumeta variegata TaxID=151549 RepID=A0A4C1TU69_EUMVA|nr:hypothetical protein EVAR_12273_1 [Eumeta japonica]